MVERIVEFFGRVGHHPVALRVDTIESIIGEDEGCTIVTKGDTHRVTADYDEAKAMIWPEAPDSPSPDPADMARR